MITLAIETSCDDTSLALVEQTNDGFLVTKMLSYSQIKTHQIYGGVVPEIASREHAQQILHVLFHMINDENIEKKWDIYNHQNHEINTKNESDLVLLSLHDNTVSRFFESIDTVSVTVSPWLPWSLSVGRSLANFLWMKFHKPVIPVNHIHGHIFSILIDKKVSDLQFPIMLLTASWGHNELYLLKNNIADWETEIGNYSISKIWQTLDDAAWEAFDKVSRMLGWPYPGGPWISKQAERWISREDIKFTRIFLKASEYNFSFSGMKSQVFRLLDNYKKEGKALNEQDTSDIAREFQEAVVEVLAKKLVKSAVEYGAKNIWIVGWVSANKRLTEFIKEYLATRTLADNSTQFLPEFIWWPSQLAYCTDNAGMIGVAGLISLK